MPTVTSDNPASCLIRDGTPRDGEVVLHLIHELAAAIDETVELTAEYLELVLEYPGSHLLLAELDGKVVGMLSYTIRPNLYHAQNCCMVDEVVVAEQARGRGVGKALLKRLVQRANEAGCAEVSLSVVAENTAAREFYKSLGFDDEAILMEMHFEPS